MERARRSPVNCLSRSCTRGAPSNLFPTQRRRLLLGRVQFSSTQIADRLEDLPEQDRAGSRYCQPGQPWPRRGTGRAGTDLRLHPSNNLDLTGPRLPRELFRHRRRDFRQVADALVAFRDPRILVATGDQHRPRRRACSSNAPTRCGTPYRRRPLRPIINTRRGRLRCLPTHARFYCRRHERRRAETALKVGGMTELLIH